MSLPGWAQPTIPFLSSPTALPCRRASQRTEKFFTSATLNLMCIITYNNLRHSLSLPRERCRSDNSKARVQHLQVRENGGLNSSDTYQHSQNDRREALTLPHNPLYSSNQKALLGLEHLLQVSHCILGQHQLRALDDVVHVGPLHPKKKPGVGTAGVLNDYFSGAD